MGEAKDPRRDAPFALGVGLLTCAVVYTLVQAVVIGLLPQASLSTVRWPPQPACFWEAREPAS